MDRPVIHKKSDQENVDTQKKFPMFYRLSVESNFCQLDPWPTASTEQDISSDTKKMVFI